jgi:hypothetical protein
MRRRDRRSRSASIKAVAEWLGHTDPAFTLATYTHLMPSSDERLGRPSSTYTVVDPPLTAPPRPSRAPRRHNRCSARRFDDIDKIF